MWVSAPTTNQDYKHLIDQQLLLKKIEISEKNKKVRQIEGASVLQINKVNWAKLSMIRCQIMLNFHEKRTDLQPKNKQHDAEYWTTAQRLVL
jgi:hypothetical protein